jgi:GTP pyrophosphokinase
MKTLLREPRDAAAPIVQLVGEVRAGDAQHPEMAQLQRARAFAEPLLAGRALDTGEDALAHADGVAAILQSIGAAPSMRAAAYLVYAGDYLQKPEEVVANAFGDGYASLVTHTRKLVQIQRAARDLRAGQPLEQRAGDTERVRKMLLAFSRDLRVVLLRLASRLQTLRHFAATKQPCPVTLAREAMQVFAPLANRLGIWQIKWELEDLAFRFLEPQRYRDVARLLDETRVERERLVEAARAQLAADLRGQGMDAVVQGRPKHLYSIWKKMQGKALDFEQVFDVRALRVIVSSVRDCYAVLSRVHELYQPVNGEFDDYIAKPKVNGYQSLHTVVQDERGRALEVQIRTREMHERAEHGVAAHWAYKEAGAKGVAGVSASGEFEEQVAQARKAVLRQLLAWERDFVEEGAAAAPDGALFDDRSYVFTPQAAIVELPKGATPIDFAYALHTDLGHRCRGARVDGHMVPLNTPLQSGQTIEVVVAKEGGPSLDWLNPELGYLRGARSKAKVRAWFNALAQTKTIAKGREAIEKLLQREGRTALKLGVLAAQLGFRSADALFEAVGKEELSLRNVETALRPPEPTPSVDELIARKRAVPDEAPEALAPRGGVLVVGVDSLLTSLARCCRPAPPDPIGGYVTRGRGVGIHRSQCSNFRHLRARTPERVIAVAWSRPSADRPASYPVDVVVEARERPGLLRDVTEAFAKDKVNVVGVKTHTTHDLAGDVATLAFTVEVADTSRLPTVFAAVAQVAGVRAVRRR